MTQKEQHEVSQQMLGVYSGILFNNQTFDKGNNEEIVYHFDCPEFVTLRDMYHLEAIAGKGSDFKRAKRLLHYLAPRLTHCSWYDNHIPCNALDLLEYSLENPKQGINCLNKSKILQECCLALGIYARRVCIMPYSPYDFDNHVVTEIYDRTMQKWIMLDATTDGFFVDETGIPLSLLEMRQKFANADFITYVRASDSLKNLKKLREKYIVPNTYICKNLFYFSVDQDSAFGVTGRSLSFIPVNYSVKETSIANAEYSIKNLPEEHKDSLPYFEKRLERLIDSVEDERTSITSMAKSPVA
jgi:hypothetical protein